MFSIFNNNNNKINRDVLIINKKEKNISNYQEEKEIIFLAQKLKKIFFKHFLLKTVDEGIVSLFIKKGLIIKTVDEGIFDYKDNDKIRFIDFLDIFDFVLTIVELDNLLNVLKIDFILFLEDYSNIAAEYLTEGKEELMTKFSKESVKYDKLFLNTP